ncbi:MAG: FAD:protein FMN transferase [Pirellulales bacterium]
MPRPTNRREFLQGKSALEAASEAIEQLVEEPPLESTVAGESYLTRIGRRAMACQFEVALNTGQYPHAAIAAVEALDLIDRLEQQMTVYRDDSEISELNATAFQDPVEVEPRLFELLSLGVRLYHDTHGAYDLTAGRLSRVWGFYHRSGRVPSAEELSEAMSRVGTAQLDLDPQRQAVSFRVPDMEINLGSIGKGYALDRAAEVMAERGIEHYLLHGGQSSVLARGSRGRFASADAAAREGWWIGVRHPLRPNQRLAEVRVLNRALATSGSAVQFFLHQGRRYGHILDPRSGRPAVGSLATTVLAPTAAEADALSTACYVLGRDAALEYCRAHPQIGLVHISPGTQDGSIDVVTSGIADVDLRWL